MKRGDVLQLISENHDVYSWYMPMWAGVNPDDGTSRWYKNFDENGKPIITNNPDEDYVSNWSTAKNAIVGSASPRFSGGLNTGLHWKGFTLSANGNFVVGNKIYNKTRESMDHDGAFTGMNLMSIDNGLGWSRWANPGDNASHPKPVSGRADGANLTSSRYLEDGSFFRLRNVTLGYNLPQSFLQKIKMTDARVYVSADNLWTLTRFSGMDPEVRLDGDTYHHAGMYSQNYPIAMTAVFGIEVTF